MISAPIDRIWNVWKSFNAKTAEWHILGARGLETNLEVMDSVRMERRLRMKGTDDESMDVL